MMAGYLAMRIEGGHLDYSIVYRKNYRQFKETVDDILTGVPLTIYSGTVIKSLVTGSTFLNVDTKEVKIYDRESNSWK